MLKHKMEHNPFFQEFKKEEFPKSGGLLNPYKLCKIVPSFKDLLKSLCSTNHHTGKGKRRADYEPEKRPRVDDGASSSAMDVTPPVTITNEEVQAIHKQIDAKDAELDDIKTKHAEDINTLTVQYNTKITDLESEKAAELHAKDEEIAKLKEDNTKLKKENATMDKETVALDSKLVAARAKISELTAESGTAANAQLEQEMVQVKRDLLLAKSDVLARDTMLNRVRDDHGGRGNFDKFMKDNFTASEIKQIKKNPLLLRLADTSAVWFEQFLTMNAELQEMKTEYNSSQKKLRAVLERCAHRVNLDDIEGLSSYRL